MALETEDLYPTTGERPTAQDIEKAVAFVVGSRDAVLGAIATRHTRAQPELADGYASLLGVAHAGDRGREAVDSVLARPLTGLWLVEAVRHVVQPEGRTTQERQSHMSQLGTLAVVAGMRAGVDVEAVVGVYNNAVHVPGVGKYCVDSPEKTVTISAHNGELRICIGGRTVCMTDSDSRDPLWLPLRRLHAAVDGQELTIDLDDIDPYRDAYGTMPAERQTEAEYQQWQDAFVESWGVLLRDYPENAAQIAAGMRTIVPLSGGTPTDGRSATNHFAFGAAGMTRPGNGSMLALGFVHEFAHSKLAAMLASQKLLHDSDDRLYYAPWRDDARPARGLLHGVVAHDEVAEFWGRRRHMAGDTVQKLYAEWQYARWGTEVARTIELVEAAGFLTEDGARIMDYIQRRIASRDRSVSPEASARARFGAADHEISWRINNMLVDPQMLDELARRFGSDRPSLALDDIVTTIATGKTDFIAVGHRARTSLMARRIRMADTFKGLCADETELAKRVPRATIGDALLISGDYAAAREYFVANIRRTPTSAAAWSGLAMTYHGVHHDPCAQVLQARPEAAAQLYARLNDGNLDPRQVAAWLA